MKKLLITISLLTAAASYAQSGFESVHDKGRIFQKIKSSSGEELTKALSSLYEKNDLDKGQKYLLVNVNQHPGLICNTTVSFKSKEMEEFDIDGARNNKHTLLIPLSGADLRALIVTACGRLSYISNEQRSASAEDAINQSISSIIVSVDGIVSNPKDSEKSRVLGADRENGSIYKIEHLD